MQVIALTGGIAAGKSTIARRLAELGAIHIDADQLAREVVAPGTPGLSAVVDRFGADVLGPDGSLDRPRLGAIVFADPVALADLNAIVHPAVRDLTRRRIAEAAERDPDAIVVYDVPLLAEVDAPRPFDLVVVAEAPADVRVDRLVHLRGMRRADALARLANQASDDERRRLADVVIDTGGSEEHTIAQVDDLWRRVRAAPADGITPGRTPQTS